MCSSGELPGVQQAVKAATPHTTPVSSKNMWQNCSGCAAYKQVVAQADCSDCTGTEGGNFLDNEPLGEQVGQANVLRVVFHIC